MSQQLDVLPEVQKIKFPALYEAASQSSAGAQASYLNLIVIEYVALVLAAVLSLDFVEAPFYFVCYALVFLVGGAAMIFRSTTKPEQAWYKSRALAESVKTTTWRYISRATPYGDAAAIQIPRAEFRNNLRAILAVNKTIGERLANVEEAGDEATKEMDRLRSQNLQERVERYKKLRILEQKDWYFKKARSNARNARRWVFASALIYAVAIAFSLLRIEFPASRFLSTEPIIALASAFIGWIQIKKFNELAASYALTAHEIGILQSRMDDLLEEEGFSSFVNEAELAFSREHTQWLARLDD